MQDDVTYSFLKCSDHCQIYFLDMDVPRIEQSQNVVFNLFTAVLALIIADDHRYAPVRTGCTSSGGVHVIIEC